tara:strand:- start:3327 stop:3971 length:645 start_codon:yes stop_codon:yes gene_type:complete
MQNILNLIYDPNVSILFFLVISGLIIRQSLVFVGQIWANTYHHLATYLLLPGIAFVITKIIKQDIALSLGMIGALSIVRFRNPVKSPFELVIFFGLLTLGIVAGVEVKIAAMLLALIVIVIFGIHIFDNIFSYFGKSFTNYSFNEANQLYSLEVLSKKKVDLIENNKNLINLYFNKENGEYSYRLIFKNRKELYQVKDTLDNSSDVVSIKLDLN